jgi:small subunit ribosomal protein S21
MAHIILRENENIEAALRRFNKKVDEEKILKEYRERQYFKKPSTKKREANKAAKRKAEVKELKQTKKFSRN